MKERSGMKELQEILICFEKGKPFLIVLAERQEKYIKEKDKMIQQWKIS